MSVELVVVLAIGLSPLLALPMQKLKWRIEDRRWNRFVDHWADTARKGVDMSFLGGCPDLGRLGKR